MAIQRINFTSAQNADNTLKTSTEINQGKNQTPEIDKEKSKAAKYMIGATAVATIIAAGILGRNGYLGKSLQKLLGGAEKKAANTVGDLAADAEKAAKEAEEKLNAETEKVLREIDEDRRLAKEAIEKSNQRNEKWLEEQHKIKEKEYEKMWLNAEKEKQTAIRLKQQQEFTDIINADLKTKSQNELDEIYETINKKLDELKTQGVDPRELNRKQRAKRFFDITPEERRYEQLLKKRDGIWTERTRRKSELLENILTKPSDKKVTVPRARTYLNSEEREALGRYYDMYPDNDALRRGADPTKFKDVMTLDKAFERAPQLEEEATVYRSLSGPPIFKERFNFVNSIKEGDIIRDPAFISTSSDATNAQFRQFADYAMEKDNAGLLMRIKLPKGTKGILGGYEEFLLPRNSQIKINKIETVDGHRVADCEYILPE